MAFTDDFHIKHLNSKSWSFLNNQEIKEYLHKWNLSLHITSWAFNKPFHPLKTENLIRSVLNKNEFPLTDLTFYHVPCTITHMDFFDRMFDSANGVVAFGRPGAIQGCYEETIENFIVGDRLRQLLLNQNDAVYELYTGPERNELIFRILSHLALGGEYCQYEDNLQPYIDTTVAIYKELLNVQKDPATGEVVIRNKCFRVVSPNEENRQKFLYIIIDPGLRQVVLFAHGFETLMKFTSE